MRGRQETSIKDNSMRCTPAYHSTGRSHKINYSTIYIIHSLIGTHNGTYNQICHLLGQCLDYRIAGIIFFRGGRGNIFVDDLIRG